MTSTQFYTTIKNPSSSWEEIEAELSRLGKLVVAFFESGHAHPLVMRSLRKERGEWLMNLGWNPLASFQSGRKILPRQCEWMTPALAGEERIAKERLDAYRNLPLPKSSWFYACARDKNIAGLTWLLNHYPDEKNEDAWWGSMKVGWEEGIDLLLSRGLDVNTPESVSGKTALHLAVETRNMPLINFLLSRKANPNTNDGRGGWVAASAIQKNFPDALLALIRAGLTMNVSLPRANTWINIAYVADSPACALHLVEAGAPLSQADERLMKQIKRIPAWKGVLASLEARTLNMETTSIVSATRTTRRI